MTTTELVTLIANIALTVSVIVALIFGIAQVKTAQKDRRERLTLETLRSFHSKEFAEMIHYITRKKVPQTHEEWVAWPAADQIEFIHFSQQMESIGILLAERYISVDLLDKTLGSFINANWEKFRPLVTEMREKFNDPYMSEYFQWMAEQIERRMNEKPRTPFFMSSKRAI